MNGAKKALLLLFMMPFASYAYASEAYQECTAVRHRAEIFYNKKLIVNLTERKYPEQVCRFFVYSPPASAPTGLVPMFSAAPLIILSAPILQNMPASAKEQGWDKQIEQEIRTNEGAILRCVEAVLLKKDYKYFWTNKTLVCRGDEQKRALVFSVTIADLKSETVYFES